MTAEILSLPNHPSLTEAELNTVADALTAFFDR
jgi:dTDP-4-amino-4,6-dideoxygalactose transaminase